MTFIVTITGQEVNLGNPRSTTHHIAAVAHSLSLINRFNGHTCRPYSVAEHSLLVCELVEQAGHGVHAQLAALMHDAHEYIIGDVATPLKPHLGGWYALEHEWATSLRSSMGYRTVGPKEAAAIKRADLIALATEKRDLLPAHTPANRPWPCLDGVEPSHRHYLMSPSRTVPAADWQHWRDTLLDKYHELVEACDLWESAGPKGFAAASPA
jgi:hypothetical protein